MRDRTDVSGEQVFQRERARSTESARRQASSSAPARCGKDGAKKESLAVIGVTH